MTRTIPADRLMEFKSPINGAEPFVCEPKIGGYIVTYACKNPLSDNADFVVSEFVCTSRAQILGHLDSWLEYEDSNADETKEIEVHMRKGF